MWTYKDREQLLELCLDRYVNRLRIQVESRDIIAHRYRDYESWNVSISRVRCGWFKPDTVEIDFDGLDYALNESIRVAKSFVVPFSRVTCELVGCSDVFNRGCDPPLREVLYWPHHGGLPGWGVVWRGANDRTMAN